MVSGNDDGGGGGCEMAQGIFRSMWSGFESMAARFGFWIKIRGDMLSGGRSDWGVLWVSHWLVMGIWGELRLG